MGGRTYSALIRRSYINISDRSINHTIKLLNLERKDTVTLPPLEAILGCVTEAVGPGSILPKRWLFGGESKAARQYS